jgi:hypothetical protein
MDEHEEPKFHINVTFETQLDKESYRVTLPLDDLAERVVSLHRPYLLDKNLFMQAIAFTVISLLERTDDDYIRERTSAVVLRAETLRLAKHMQIIVDSFADGIEIKHTSKLIEISDEEENDDDGA